MVGINLFTLVLFGASFITFVTASFAWSKRTAVGGPALTLMFFSIAIWCFFSAMETTSFDEFHMYLWAAFGFIGLCNVAPLLLVFAIQYSESRWPLSPWMLAAVWSIPGTTIVLAFTNGFHHLVWRGVIFGPVTGATTAIYLHGPWYFVLMFWFVSLSVLASYHLLRLAFQVARVYAMQATVYLASIIIPWIGFLLSILPNSPLYRLDATSVGFAISAILIVVAFNRLHFLDLVPRARTTLIEGLQEGVVVLDRLDRVVDMNPAACRFLKIDPSIIGRKLGDVVSA